MLTGLIIKFNGGKLALICNRCRKIIKIGKEFNEAENKYSKSDTHLLDIFNILESELTYQIMSDYCNECYKKKLKGAVEHFNNKILCQTH